MTHILCLEKKNQYHHPTVAQADSSALHYISLLTPLTQTYYNSNTLLSGCLSASLTTLPPSSPPSGTDAC